MRELVSLINHFLSSRRNCIGIEIGVDKARSTHNFLKNCSWEHFYAIDPYYKRNLRFQKIKDDLYKYENCTLLRMSSDEAIEHVPEFDFIFIDGDHSYKQVYKDLRNYITKLKPGGLLTGHDWTHKRGSIGVVKACTEFFLEYNNLFEPLLSNKNLKELGFHFKRGGNSSNGHVIHKKIHSQYPTWWRQISIKSP